MRAKEVCGLAWSTACHPGAQVRDFMSIEGKIAKKGRGGIPLHTELETALIALRKNQALGSTLNLVKGWFKAV